MMYFKSGSDPNEEKTSLPSLPKQIQDDLHKFRKAQSRRMLHDRLHSYINHLHDNNNKAPDSILPRPEIKLNEDVSNSQNENIVNRNYVPDARVIQSNENLMPISSTLTSGTSPQPNLLQTNSSTCVSGKSSPIGRRLQQLSISENDSSLLQGDTNQQLPLNNSQFHHQEITDGLLSDEDNHILSVSNIFDTIPTMNSVQAQGSIQNTQTTNRNNENSNTIGYNIF